MTTASRSSNGSVNGGSIDALGALGRVERRRLKSEALAHDFTTEERQRGAQRTNEIKRERATAPREAQVSEEAIDTIYLLTADKLVLQQTLNRLSAELCVARIASTLSSPPGSCSSTCCPRHGGAARGRRGNAHARQPDQRAWARLGSGEGRRGPSLPWCAQEPPRLTRLGKRKKVSMLVLRLVRLSYVEPSSASRQRRETRMVWSP